MKKLLLSSLLVALTATLHAEPTLYKPAGWVPGTEFSGQPEASETGLFP